MLLNPRNLALFVAVGAKVRAFRSSTGGTDTDAPLTDRRCGMERCHRRVGVGCHEPGLERMSLRSLGCTGSGPLTGEYNLQLGNTLDAYPDETSWGNPLGGPLSPRRRRRSVDWRC